MLIELFKCNKCGRVYPLIITSGGYEGTQCPHVVISGAESLGSWRITPNKYPYTRPVNTVEAHREAESA